MAEGIRAPNLPVLTELSEFLGIQTVGTQKSVGRATRASVLGNIDAIVNSFVVGGGVIFKTLSDALAALNYDPNQMAWVIQDATPVNNGIYQKTGASGSGSWSRVGDLPYSFYRAVNEGAGTANAIKATNGYPMANRDALIVVNITDTNTAAPVTLSLNDASPIIIKTASGNDVAVGGLVAGMVIAGYIDGAEFRLLSDQASAAIQAAAEAAQAAAEAARDVAAGAMSTFIATVFDTKATALAYHPVAAPTYLRLEGMLSPGDGGDGLYKNNGTTTGDIVLTLSDGTTHVGFTRVGRDLSCEVTGAYPNQTVALGSEMNDAAIAAAALGLPLYIPAGTYKFTAEVDFSPMIGSKIILGGEVVFDFTGATNAALFPHFGHVVVIGAALTTLPDLSASMTKGGMTAAFASAHGLSPLDRFCTYNPTDGSFNAQRTYYRAGEWYQVFDVTDSMTIRTRAGSYAAYDKLNVDVYKHPSQPIEVTGGTLTIKESVASGFDGVAGFRAERIVESDFSAIRPTNSLYAGLMLHQCIDLYGSGYLVRQRNTAGGNAYGVVFSNSQGCHLYGTFEGGRHGVATGGLDGIGCVPVRDCYTYGFHRNSPDAAGGIGAWNSHGNSEYCGAEGVFEGGLSPGGDFMKFRGRIRTHAGQNGWAVFVSENIGLNFDFEGMVIEGAGNPASSGAIGVVDFSSQTSNGMNANMIRGGRVNLNNVKFICPDAQILIAMANQGFTTTQRTILTLQGASWLTDAASPIVVRTQKNSGSRCLDRLSVHGFNNGSGAVYSMDSAPLVAGWRARGAVTVNTSTSSNSASASATWPTPAPKAPIVIPLLPSGSVAGEPVQGFYTSENDTGATIGIITSTKANFPSGTNVSVKYDAALDEF